MKVSEDYLNEFIKCPLRVPPTWKHEYAVSDQVTTASIETTRWFISRCFDGNVPDMHWIQVAFEKEWGDIDREVPIAVPIVRRIGKHLLELHRTFKVIQPIGYYSLIFNGTEIEGEYGVVASRGKIPTLYVVKLLETDDSLGYPSPGHLASWLHYRAQSPNLGTEVGIASFAIPAWRYSLRSDIIESVAKQYVARMIETVLKGNLYPSPGAYCPDCPTQACLAVFKEDHGTGTRRNDHRFSSK